MTRQAVAKHLATLADAGLVESERQGRETRFRLTDAGEEWDDRLDALRSHLKRRRTPMSLYDTVRELPLSIEGYRLEPLEREVARGFTLRRTVVVLYGRGEEGRGEEVDYDPRAQERFQADEGKLPFPGEHTLDSFSLLQAGQTEYRRWGFESAALDLALRQAGRSLGEAVGREPQPLGFVVSTRTAKPRVGSGSTPICSSSSTRTAIGRTRSSRTLHNVETVDFKGIYRGAFGNPPDAELYARVAAAFPEAWIEDPALTPGRCARSSRTSTGSHGTRRSTNGATSRRSFKPKCLNCKPSRFGSVKRLFDFYDACAREGIALYGGGQYELGPGRDQIQLLASLFHADAPNDVAPSGYNAATPVEGLPQPPLQVDEHPGFR